MTATTQTHTRQDWTDLIKSYATKASTNDDATFVNALIDVAALAVAAAESPGRLRRPEGTSDRTTDARLNIAALAFSDIDTSRRPGSGVAALHRHHPTASGGRRPARRDEVKVNSQTHATDCALRFVDPWPATARRTDALDGLLSFYWRWREVVGCHIQHSQMPDHADAGHWLTLIHSHVDRAHQQSSEGAEFEDTMLTIASLAVAAIDTSRRPPGATDAPGPHHLTKETL